MTIRPLRRAEVRSIDHRAAEEFGLPTLVLMENAGRGAAERLRDWVRGFSRIVLLCGGGNNGGDAGVVARHLDAWGFDIRVVWCADPGHLAPDAAVQHRILAHSGIDQLDLPNADPATVQALLRWADHVVDGLLGTGLSRPVEGSLATLIQTINEAGKPVVALDVPSGLDCDRGVPLGTAVRAALTTTFVAPKAGFSAPEAAAYTGEVQVVEIGVPRCVLRAFQVA